MRKEARSAAIVRVEMVLILLDTYQRLAPESVPVTLGKLRSWYVCHLEGPFKVKSSKSDDPVYCNHVASGLLFVRNLILMAEKNSMSLGKTLELLRSSALTAAREAGLCHSQTDANSIENSELLEMCRDFLLNQQ